MVVIWLFSELCFSESDLFNISFTYSWLARSYYLRPIQKDVDDYLEYYFRCNSTLTNEDTVYNVDCIIDENFSDTLSSIIRRQDATISCSKYAGTYCDYPGVSLNRIIIVLL